MKETVIEFVIDLSGSMGDKIDLTKQMLLNDLIPMLDYSSRIGIKSFSAVSGVPPVIQELPLSILDKSSLIEAIKKLTVKQGGTPISEAIRQSVKTLKEFSANQKKIILVTDGEEDKGGNYVSECKKARTDGIDCEIHVIGIGLSNSASEQAKEIAKLTNGSYSHIAFTKGIRYDQQTIKNNLSFFYDSNSLLASTSSNKIVTDDIKSSFEAVKKASDVKENNIDNKPDNNSKSAIEEKSMNITLAKDLPQILEQLVNDVRDIKKDLKNIKGSNEDTPEVIEDPIINEKVRVASESHLFEFLKKKYPNRVIWLNEHGECGSDHDFEITEDDGSIEYYIECKGTPSQKPTFYVTKNEWLLFLNNTQNYQIYFIQNVFSSPSIIFINNLLDWLLKGKVLPCLKNREVVKEDRVVISISDSYFI